MVQKARDNMECATEDQLVASYTRIKTIAHRKKDSDVQKATIKLNKKIK